MDKTSKHQPQSVKDILLRFNPVEDKYISREFQSFGIYLAQELNEQRKKSLYIKLARDVPRPVLEKALSFVKEAGNVQSRGKLFMWKLSELMGWKRKSKPRV